MSIYKRLKQLFGLGFRYVNKGPESEYYLGTSTLPRQPPLRYNLGDAPPVMEYIRHESTDEEIEEFIRKFNHGKTKKSKSTIRRKSSKRNKKTRTRKPKT